MDINIKQAEVPGTYIIIDKDNTKAYVGSTTDLRRRALRHVRELKDKEHHNWELQELHDKGKELTFIGLPTEDKEQALDLEQAIIDDFYNSNLLCNIATDARDSAKGLPLSPEHKAKLIEANTGVPKSKEHREAISKTLTGRKQTPEIAQMLRTVNVGRKFTDEHKAKIGTASKGRIYSEESRLKMSESGKNKIITDEHKRNLSLNSARIGIPITKENKQKLIESNQKKVSINGVIYNSISEASSDLNLSPKVMFNRLKSDKFPEFQRL